MIFNRIWAMSNKWTFTIKPIKDLLGRVLPKGEIIDPFAGKYSPGTYTNDLNPDNPANSHMDALEFLKTIPADRKFDAVILDPPYSITKAIECYKSYGKNKLKINVSNMAYWKEIKDRLANMLKPGGLAICCGWTSQGLGKTRGFKLQEILLVPHGGSKNDTIITVERKNNEFNIS